MKGEYEEIVVWNRPLSESEISGYFSQTQSLRDVCPNEPAICRNRVAQFAFEDNLVDDAMTIKAFRRGNNQGNLYQPGKFGQAIWYIEID